MRPPDTRVLPKEPPDPADRSPGGRADGPGGLSGLSPASLWAIVVTAVAVVAGAAVHLAVVFLAIAPPNDLSQRHATGISRYLGPEFAQQWRLFAPNPSTANTHVHARAQIETPDGTLTTTRWLDMTAEDETRIAHHPLPGQAYQNELRVAWNNFIESLDGQGRPTGLYGSLMRRYLVRIAVQRLGTGAEGGTVRRVQLRSAVTPVPAPPWSYQYVDTRTSYLVQPWWTVGAEDAR
ncbi:DUF5819 family protein [Streptomyces achromogenes]|uniref:DUF5819 family protein n=1 Tax=Streptomyces achromogenes TaxID=67255 RepID=UPI003701A6AF